MSNWIWILEPCRVVLKSCEIQRAKLYQHEKFPPVMRKAVLDRECARCNDGRIGHASSSRGLGTRDSPVQPSLTKLFFLRYCYVSLAVLLTAKGCRPISAASNFSVQSTSYDCSFNFICMGNAHASNEASEFAGLSLLSESIQENDVGLAYYREAVRLKDPVTRQSASLNTSFTVSTVLGPNRTRGDGFAFLISANNNTIGSFGGSFGIFSPVSETSASTSVVVEFDTYQNVDIGDFDSDNHVSFDFNNISWAAGENASKVNVLLGDNQTLYAWVEYSTQQLEVRISNQNSRPVDPLLGYTVDLFDVVEEYMWVGFSAGSGFQKSDYFVGNWTFESYGISPSSQVQSTDSERPPKPVLAVGISVGVVSLLLTCILIFALVHRRISSAYPIEEDLTVRVEGMPERFPYKQLSVATRNFSEDSKLGQGGFGSVHRGVLPSGMPIAVKKINENSTQGEREFMAEVSIISKLKHRNLIRLLGWCRDAARGNYLLVYELMPNGSLDKVLFGPAVNGTPCLSWPQRFNIVRDTAAALDYLHQGWTQQVIHRDIKSSNIMLDEKWNAKLGDFGLARLVDHERTAAATVVAGTQGYIAPEVVAFGKFTAKSDVYAFGAVVLEIACGRKALVPYLAEDEMILVDWVWQKLSEDNVLSTVDKRLKAYDTDQMEVMLKVGLLCSHPNPLARPSMRHVLQILAGDAPAHSIPASRPVLIFSSDPQGVLIEEVGSQNIENKSNSPSKWVTKVCPDSAAGIAVKSSGTYSTANSSFKDHICSGVRVELDSR